MTGDEFEFEFTVFLGFKQMNVNRSSVTICFIMLLVEVSTFLVKLKLITLHDICLKYNLILSILVDYMFVEL